MREHAPRTYRSATHTGTGRRSLESIRSRVGNSFYGTYGIATRPVEEAWLPERGLTHTHAPDARDVPLGRGSTRGDLTRPVSYCVSHLPRQVLRTAHCPRQTGGGTADSPCVVRSTPTSLAASWTHFLFSRDMGYDGHGFSTLPAGSTRCTRSQT